MYQWQKLGLIFDPRDHPGRHWMAQYAQAPATLVKDDIVRVYFSCRPAPDENGQYTSYSSYVDLEREDLTRVRRVANEPVLPLGDIGTFDEFGVYPMSVIRDGDLVRAYYGGWTRCVSTPYTVAIGAAVSRDEGQTFSRLGPGPVLAQTPMEAFVLSGPKIRRFGGQWQMFYVAGIRWKVHQGRPESIYRARMATSQDGLNWNRDASDLLEVKLDDDECQASPDVIFSGGRYHMFFCYKHGVNFRNSARGYRIGYAYSDDLVRWVRRDEVAGIDVSPSGWDSESIAYPHLLELDGETYMFYLGNEVGRSGFGIAKLQGHLG